MLSGVNKILLVALTAFCMSGCIPSAVGDGAYNNQLVVEAASSGIASLVEDKPKIFVARRNMLLSGIAVLYQVTIDGEVVGNLGNGEKASYSVNRGRRTLIIRNMGPDGTGTNIEGEITVMMAGENKYYLAYSAMGWTKGRLKISEKSEAHWLKL